MAARRTRQQDGTRLEKLQTLAALLASEIDGRANIQTLPALAKQYRETLKEIEELEGAQSNEDEIGELLAQRQADGKPRAVRKNRAGV